MVQNQKRHDTEKSPDKRQNPLHISCPKQTANLMRVLTTKGISK